MRHQSTRLSLNGQKRHACVFIISLFYVAGDVFNKTGLHLSHEGATLLLLLLVTMETHDDAEKEAMGGAFLL
jgi:hypothetical protein